MAKFRVVFQVSSGLRLQDTLTDPPSTWTFPWEIDGQDVELIIRDRISEEQGFPEHRGFEVQVVLEAANLDEAVRFGSGLTLNHLPLLSTIGRGPIGSPTPVLAYELTPGIPERAFRQWIGPISMPSGKPQVPNPPFGDVFHTLVSIEDAEARRPIQLAVEFYAAARRETEPVLRFMLLWISCEGLDRLLRKKLTRAQKDRFWGLKALAEANKEDAALIAQAYKLRNEIFHSQADITTKGVVDRAGPMAERLDALIPKGVLVLLDAADKNALLPAEAVSNHPTTLMFSANVRGDSERWSPDCHPHVQPNVSFEFSAAHEDGSLTLKMPGTFRVSNCEGMTPLTYEMWGPSGLRMEVTDIDVQVLRNDDEKA